jgi:mono/diheme cytochrome c family protein
MVLSALFLLSLAAGLNSAPPATKSAVAEAPRPALTPDTETVAAGKPLFEQFCAACHGLTGAGQPPLAPPLANSNWLFGPEGRLIRIVLNGLEGPIQVNGTNYAPPAILPEMASLAALEDAQIASILSFVRRDWGRGAGPVSAEQVARIRSETAKRETAWTEAELSQIK